MNKQFIEEQQKKAREEFSETFGGVVLEANAEVGKFIDTLISQTILATEAETLGKVIALKINMPSEREYPTNPTGAYTTGFETAVNQYRNRINELINTLTPKL